VHILQAKLVCCLHPHGDFFNGAGTIIARWPVNGNLRRLGLVGGNKIVLREAHVLPVLQRGHVIRAVLLHVDGGGIDVVSFRLERNRLPTIEH